MLLEHGAAVGAENEEGRTPLHLAASNGIVELVRVLLEHGAEVNTRAKVSWTPLFMAVQNGRVEVIQLLIKHGANTGVEDEDGVGEPYYCTRRGN